MEKQIKVLLVDDHEVVREGIRRMLEMHPQVEVVGEASNAEEALALAEELAPDVILMDIKLPVVNGLEATRKLKEKRGSSAIIILSLYDQYLAQAMAAGASGYLSKDVKRAELFNAILRAHKGEVVIGTGIMSSPSIIESGLKQLQEMVTSRPGMPVEHVLEAPTAPPLPDIGELVTPAAAPGRRIPPSPEPTHQPVGQVGLPRSTPLEQRPRSPVDKKATSTTNGWTDAGRMEKEKPLPSQSLAATSLSLEENLLGETTASPASDGKARGEEVELILPPAVDATLLVSFCSRLKRTISAQILETIGAWDEPTTIRVVFWRPVSLMEVLGRMAEVAEAWEEKLPPRPTDGSKKRNGGQEVAELPTMGVSRRVHVVLKASAKSR